MRKRMQLLSWVYMLFLLALCVNLWGCQKKPAGSIPSIEEVTQMSVEEAADLLVGCRRNDLYAAWGSPTMCLSGLPGDWWEYGQYGGEITVYYEFEYYGEYDEISVTSAGISPDVYTIGLSAWDRKVDRFLRLSGYEGASDYIDDTCYNVSMEQLASYGFEVFQFEKSCAAFLVYDGEVYELGSDAGAGGLTYFAVADLNQDGYSEFYFTYIMDPQQGYSKAGYFDSATREVTIFDTIFYNELCMMGVRGEDEDAGLYEAIGIYEGNFDVSSSVNMVLRSHGEALGEICYLEEGFVLEETQEELDRTEE